MRTRAVRRLCLVTIVASLATGVGVVNAPPAVAYSCGIDANMSVSRQPNGGWYVSGSGNAYCYAPPPPINYISVSVGPSNALIRLLVSGSSSSAANGCSNGACSITPVFFGYGVAPNALITLLNGNRPLCFTASFSATYGGSRSVTACG